jgi:hypothetical protein
MQRAQFIRPWGFLLVLGLAGFLLGCSGQGPSPSDKTGTGKTLKEEMKAERKEAAAERAEAKKGMMMDRRRGKGPG